MAEIFDFYVADNRTIKFNPIEPILQEDNGVAVWRFRIPKMLNNIDMSGFAWWFVYINAAKQKYSEPLTLTADADDPDNYCIADYTIDYGISLTPGSFTFALEAINANGSGEIIEEWHTKTYSHSVIGTLQGNQAEYSETESDIISALIVQIQEKYNALVGGATPIPVASISAMTDTSKIYLLTTDNNWYCYNGSTWVSGGLYASGIVIDPTLTQSGQAADAKVVGDEIDDLNDAIQLIASQRQIIHEYGYGDVDVTSVDGYYINSNGTPRSSNGYSYIMTQVTSESDVWAVTGVTWHQFAVYSNVPLSSDTLVLLKVNTDALPTEENPVHVLPGQYVVVVEKSVTVRGYKIFVKSSEIASLNEDLLPETNSRLTALEEKIDEPSGNYSSGSALLYRRNLPSYYLADAGDDTNFDDNEYIQTRLNAIPDGKHFIFVTDTHWDNSRNTRKTNDLIQYVRSRIGDVDVVFGGDVVNKNATKYAAVKVMRSYLNESIDSYGNKFIPVLGNHDVNGVHREAEEDPDVWFTPYSVINPIWTNHLKGRAIFRDETEAIATKTSDTDLAAEYDAYFRFNYVINTNDGTTIIVYNTGAGGPFVSDAFGLTGEDEIYLHQQWLYETLMRVPEGNDVVLVGHEATYGKPTPLNSWNNRSAVTLLTCFVKKQLAKLYIMPSAVNEKTYPWIPNTQYPQYDFTNAPNVGKVFIMQGHWHHDFVTKVGADDNSGNYTPLTVAEWNEIDHFRKSYGEIPIICTICDAYGTYVNRNSEGNYTTIPTDFVMEAGTVTEQAFDVVTITENSVVTTRFGAAEKPSDLRRELFVDD